MNNVGDITRTVIDLNRIAIIDTGKTPHQKVTFQDLNWISNGVANALLARNLKAKSKIAIIAENSAEFIMAYYGILKSGHIAVLMNPKLPKNQIHQILKESHCGLVFCDQKFEGLLPSGQAQIVLDRDFKNFAKQENFDSAQVHDDDIALILLTSGSSADPVGVELLHKRLGWRIEQSLKLFNMYTQNPGFISFVLSPFFHMNGFFSSQALLAGGGTIVIQPRFDSRNFAENLNRYKVVFFTGVPSMLALLIEYLKNHATPVFSSVKAMMLGSAPLTENLLNEIKKYFPAAESIRNNYGLTEVGPNLFGNHPDGLPTPNLSVGFPRPGIEYKLVNEVLFVRSPSMMRGYSKADQSLAERVTDEGFFNTKDIFRIDENGFYYFVSRSDDMIVCGGHNIYLSNIDRILENHPAVNQAVTVALADEIKGQKPYSFIRLKEEIQTTGEELRRYLLEALPPYAVPRKIWRTPKFPLGPTGKIDRKYLQKLAEDILAGANKPSEDEVSEF